MTREQALHTLLDEIKDDLVVVSNGKISREVFELRKKRKELNDDLVVQGAMGSVIGVGIGVAMHTKKKVWVLTGDGALLMKLGSIVSAMKPWNIDNLNIVVLNNESHASTGGQPTYFYLIKDYIKKHFRVIDVEGPPRKNLGRPDISCAEITKRFMEKCQS